MVDFFSWQAMIAYALIALIALLYFGRSFLEDIQGYFVSKQEKQNKIAEINKIIDDISSYKENIFLNGGVLAPAVIISANRVLSWGSGSHRGPFPSHLIDFEADVMPADAPVFRTKFRNEVHRNETYRNSYTIIGDEVISEHGRKIWVTYDPKDPSRAYLDHYDEDHEFAMKEREINGRRAAFNKLTEGNEDLKIHGEQAEAIITRVDDLNLPYPMNNARAMHICFEVTPKVGFPFEAEGDVLIGETAIKKYSVGKKVFVRIDRNNPKWAVLDTERNKSIE